MESVIKPKSPHGPGWVKGPRTTDAVTLGFEGYYWFFPERDIVVISSLEVAKDVGSTVDKGPEFHISISRGGRARCDRNDARFVLKAFDMEYSDEDNHVPNGVVRNFWKPVADKFIGHICECKDSEPAMVEDKGDFVWRGITS